MQQIQTGTHVHVWQLGPEVAGVSHGVCACGAERDFAPRSEAEMFGRQYTHHGGKRPVVARQKGRYVASSATGTP